MPLMPTTKPQVPALFADLVAERAAEVDIVNVPDIWSREEMSIRTLLTTEPPPPDWLVHELLLSGSVGLLIGAGGSYKSTAMVWLGLQLAIASLYPSSWLGRFPLTLSRKICYVSLEDSRDDVLHPRLHLMLNAFCEDNKLPADAVTEAIDKNFTLIGRELFFGGNDPLPMMSGGVINEDKLGRLIRSIKAVGADLVLIDTKSRFFANEENSNGDAALEIGVLERIRDEAGCRAVLMSHHSNKGSRQAGGDVGTSARGASALTDNSRFVMSLSREVSDDADVTLKVDLIKSNYGPPIGRFICTVDYPRITYDPDASTGSNADLLPALVQQWVTEHPGVSRGDAEERPDFRTALGGIGIGKVRQAHRSAEDQGLIYCEAKGRERKYYASAEAF